MLKVMSTLYPVCKTGLISPARTIIGSSSCPASGQTSIAAIMLIAIRSSTTFPERSPFRSVFPSGMCSASGIIVVSDPNRLYAAYVAALTYQFGRSSDASGANSAVCRFPPEMTTTAMITAHTVITGTSALNDATRLCSPHSASTKSTSVTIAPSKIVDSPVSPDRLSAAPAIMITTTPNKNRY